jgi:HSP20 family protein
VVADGGPRAKPQGFSSKASILCERVFFAPLDNPTIELNFSFMSAVQLSLRKQLQNRIRKEGEIMIVRRIPNWPRWGYRSPFDELERMRKEMDTLAGALTGGVLREPMAGVFPLMNVSEDKDNYYVRAELPGIKADELDISVTGKDLSIAGERKIASEDEKAKYHRREREAGRFSRIISVPGEIDAERVDAGCADGVLTVVLPKAQAVKPRQISVKAS